MSKRFDNWVLREELKDADALRSCRRALTLLNQSSFQEKPIELPSGGTGIPVVRYWGYRVSGKLTVVHRSDETSLSGTEKTLSFARDWRDAEAPANVKPVFASEKSVVEFSPLESDRWDFSRLYAIPESFSDRGRLIATIIEFFNRGVTELNGSTPSLLNGFNATIKLEMYLVADKFCISQGGKERTFWVNANTNQVWELSKSGEIVSAPENNRMARIALFVGCFLGVAGILWCIAFYRNIVGFPQVSLGTAFGLVCIGTLILSGVFIRGWSAKLVSLTLVALCAYELTPWIGDAWDMTTEAVLATFFAPAEWLEAPIGATYLACSLVLTLLAAGLAPSLALKVDGAKMKIAASGMLLAVAVSPWPKALGEMRESSPLLLRCGVCAMVILNVFLVGQSGWAVSEIGVSHDELHARIVKSRHSSNAFFLIASVIVVFLIWTQILLVWQ